MTAQRRTALFSVIAAVALIALKLATGLATHSLGLLSEAAHSGTDLVAALLTFFALGVAGRPADPGHQYGHGKAENLAALGEGAILVLASGFIVWRAIVRLTGGGHTRCTRRGTRSSSSASSSWSTSRARSLPPALRAGTRAPRSRRTHCTSRATSADRSPCSSACCSSGRATATPTRSPRCSSRCIVLVAAVRLMRGNVDVLMDRAPLVAEEAARRAIVALRPAVDLRRLRMRQAAGRHFADVVIGISPDAAVGQGHAAADAVEQAVQEALPEADVVVHVEPLESEAAVRERAHAAALAVPARARGAQRQRPVRRRFHRGLAPPEAAGRPLARGGARDRRGGRARDHRRRPRGRGRADASRAAHGGGGCGRGDRRRRHGARDRPRGGRRRRRTTFASSRRTRGSSPI